jgi:hypothetical protein
MDGPRNRSGPATTGPPRTALSPSTTTRRIPRPGTGVVVDLATWRRLRRTPAGGDWWGGRPMWTWAEAERSRRRLPA